MTKTCYLHVGSPKTGSTSIQKWFFSNKQALEKQGILYPGSEQRHNAILSKFHDDPTGIRFHWQNNRRTIEKVRKHDDEVITHMFDEIRRSSATYFLISNEAFIGQGKHIDCTRLKDELSDLFDRIVVVAYVRDPLKAMISRSQEQVKSGVRRYETVIRKPHLVPVSNFNIYTRVFGRENCIVRNFDEIVKSKVDIVEDLITLISPELELDSGMPFKQVNTSLSLEAAMIIGSLNGQYKLRDNKGERKLKISDIRGIGSTKFGVPKEAILGRRSELLAQYDYLRDILGVDFPVPDFDAIESPVADWGPETMQQLALAMNELAKKRPKKRKTTDPLSHVTRIVRLAWPFRTLSK